MCEFCGEKGQLYSFIQRGMPGGLVTPFMQEIFPFMFQPYHCPVCGRKLMPHELNGPTTRSLCSDCYNDYILSYVSLECMMCERRLPGSKVREQERNIRDVRAKIHEGDCLARWVAVHNVAHGEQDVIRALSIVASQGYGQGYQRNPYQRHALPMPSHRQTLPVPRLPAPGRQGRRVNRQALPYPSHQVHVPDQMPNHERDLGYIDAEYHDWNRHR
jgi:hypothetical protein